MPLRSPLFRRSNLHSPGIFQFGVAVKHHGMICLICALIIPMERDGTLSPIGNELASRLHRLKPLLQRRSMLQAPLRWRKLATGPTGAMSYMSAYQGLQSRLLLLALITTSIHRTVALDATCISNSGAVVSLPGQPDWQTDKSVFNSKINKMPLAVVYAQTEAQVQETIRCASSAGIRVVPRGGGHAYEGML